MTEENAAPANVETTDLAPLVSICVFLHNEERFVRQSLESLLMQDYPNLEIVVSDNCSTDRTAEICNELAEQDQRIRFTRQKKNIGAGANSIYVLQHAKGKYLMWASGHDLWSPNLISLCVDALEQRPEASLSYGPNGWIDNDGKTLERVSGGYDTRGMSPIGRMFMTFWGNAHPVVGLIRTEFLQGIPKIHACVGMDQIILAELALRGEFLYVPETTWSRREPRKHESYPEKVKRYTSAEFGLVGSRLDRVFPLLRLPLEVVRAVWRSELNFFEKLAVTFALPPTFLVRYLSGRQT